MNERSLVVLLRGWMWLRRRARPTETQWNLVLAALVGVVGAFLAIVFQLATLQMQHWFTGAVGGTENSYGVLSFNQLSDWQRLVIPTAGGLLAGIILLIGERYVRQKATDYMEAITLGDGNVPARSSLYRSLAAMFSIASGASIGKEGPLVQLSAMGASLLCRQRGYPPARRRLLVACGAAAGIAAAYNAPIAAALFVSEISVGTLAMESLGPLIFASVASIITAHLFYDASPLYRLDNFATPSIPEMLCFAVLGVVCGLMAGVFLGLLSQFHKWLQRVPASLPVKMMFGGVVVGLLAMSHPDVTGNGQVMIRELLDKDFLWKFVLLTLLAKMIATSTVFGVGAVGGVFTPTLLVGACTGYLCWYGFVDFFPGLNGAQDGFTTIGMGAMLAAATQAPFMSILMIFEMTLSYQVMVPLMLASVIAYYTFRGLGMHSLYHHGPPDAYDIFNRPLETLTVADIMQAKPRTVGPHAGFAEIARQFLAGGLDRQYVVGPNHNLLGVIRLEDMAEHLYSPALAGAFIAGDLAHERAPALETRTALPEALVLFTREHEHELPVLKAGTRELAGTLSRNDLLLTLAEAGKRGSRYR